jgi:hypothetical protein
MTAFLLMFCTTLGITLDDKRQGNWCAAISWFAANVAFFWLVFGGPTLVWPMLAGFGLALAYAPAARRIQKRQLDAQQWRNAAHRCAPITRRFV